MVSIINTPFEGELKHPFKYELDHFQKHSVNIMNTVNPCNILVTAHTGSGKSLVAEYAILKALELGKKAIYCSPIKTLSNQKFYEFKHKYPNISVGIITGDNKHNPMADCLIMTTEILMIMLSKGDIRINEMSYNIDIEKEVYAIIFDEVHYINDYERGNIWEKSIMTVPKNVSIIMLSATIDRPENFLTWVHTCNNNKSFLLSNEKRVVPLRFGYGVFCTKIPKILEKYSGNINFITNIMESDSKYINEDILNKYFLFYNYFKENKTNFRWLIGDVCKYLYKNEMCPAIFFVFSKKVCFTLAESITESFIDSQEAKLVEKDILYYLSKLDHKEEYMKTPQYHKILALAKKGIAVHHSGLIPVFKEIIEMLFSKNYIKILFATETFAVGLNMPTKTVVFSDLAKFDNNGKRLLYSHEFIQMSGRAGRRGLDKIGHVILLPQIFKAEMERADLKDLMMGKPQVLKSKFSVDANLVLESIKNNNFDKLEDFVKKTLLSTEIEKEKNGLNHNIAEMENKLKVIKVDNKEIFEEHANIKKQLYSEIQPSNNQKKKLIAKLKDIESSDEYKKNINNYKSYETYKNNLDKYLKEKENLESFLGMDINDKIKFLTDKGYFQEKELTLKGKVGLIFRELDNIIGSEIIFNEFIDQFDDRKYLTLLTLLTEGRNDEEIEINEDHIEVYLFVEDMWGNIRQNREYVNPILDWYDNTDIHIIINNYEIFEGDLIKNINKIINFIDELKEGYIMKNNLKFVDMLSKIREKLCRDIVSTESLYLKL